MNTRTENLLNDCYVIISVSRKGIIENKKFIEFKTDKDAVDYIKEKNHYKTREESTNSYFVYKIKEA